MRGLLELFIVVGTGICLVEGDQLLLLQAIWRHGDRAPIKKCLGDPISEKDWPRGWGQLTAEGMAQHVKLGKIIYNRYVKELKFLSPLYNANEIYVRSTDVNRTLLSAVSNFIGFYNNPYVNERTGIDFPNITEWPQGFVAVPVHTVKNEHDFIGNPSAKCPRQDWLRKMMYLTTEWKDLSMKYENISNDFEKICKESVSLHDLWGPVDAFYCEKLHGFQIAVNDALYEQLTQINNKVQNFENGLDLKPYDGIDFKHEIGKIRGGSVLWSMLNHFDLKLHCLQPKNRGTAHCKWMENLNYYAYSAHDTTLAALMCTLDAKFKILNSNEYPRYSSSMLFELWDTKNGPALKAYYHRNFTQTELEDVTSLLDHCADNMDSDGYCNYHKFRASGIPYYPGDKDKLCQDTTSKKTYFNPDEPQPKSAPMVSYGPVVMLLVALQLLVPQMRFFSS
ncbi:unnamed protein product [Thelazia callipaeda]|uniref:acid phosphatase n=1 Tax=Thelazia callipaeda TaxID=103827 RepID=A0A0N5D461_THECL|nr:unnamed protein product [Thelazia callipaeda]